LQFIKIKALWSEKRGMQLIRKDTGNEYIFLHYLTSVSLLLEGHWIRIKEGGCIIYDKHSYQHFVSDECELLHDWFHATGNCTEIIGKYGLKFNTVYYPQDSKFITSIIQAIEIEQLKQDIFCNEICDDKADELFARIARGIVDLEEIIFIGADIKNRFLELRTQINREFNNGWKIDTLAALVNLSPSRFHALYKEIFLISPKKDLINIRIEHAESLLLHTSYSIESIASMVGYSNPFNFIRQFKQIKNITPGQYRKAAL